MNTNQNRKFLAVAIAISLATGFGLSQFFDALHTPADGASVESAEEAGHDGEEHAEGEDGHDEEGHDDEGLVELTRRQIEASGISIVNVTKGGGRETRLIGRVESAIDARADVIAISGGRVEQVLVAPGTSVQVGQTLAVITSGNAASLRADADAATAESEAARLVYARDQTLVEQGVVARQEMEASRARSLAADAAARSAQAQLEVAGSPDAAGRVVIKSPVAGTVGAVSVAPGGFVNAGGTVARISDPTRTELVFNAVPALVSQVSAGTVLEVNGPSGSFEAVVQGVAADVSEQNSAAIIRARATSVMLPPAGSPVVGIIVTNRDEDGLTVPAAAVQSVEGQSVVFVLTDEGFRVTPVLAGQQAGDSIEVLNGLSGSEQIAGTNAFLLKAELAKGEAEHGH